MVVDSPARTASGRRMASAVQLGPMTAEGWCWRLSARMAARSCRGGCRSSSRRCSASTLTGQDVSSSSVPGPAVPRGIQERTLARHASDRVLERVNHAGSVMLALERRDRAQPCRRLVRGSMTAREAGSWRASSAVSHTARCNSRWGSSLFARAFSLRRSVQASRTIPRPERSSGSTLQRSPSSKSGPSTHRSRLVGAPHHRAPTPSGRGRPRRRSLYPGPQRGASPWAWAKAAVWVRIRAVLQPVPLLRHRRPRPGPELDLIASAFEAGVPMGFPGSPEILREPELPVGSPDVVAVFPRRTFHAERQPLDETHVRVLHQIWLSGGVDINALSFLIHMAPRKLARVIRVLDHLGLVRCRGEYCTARPLASIFPIRQIVAIEAKISDWRTGLEQAESNLWFASVSYLLVPKRKSPESLVKAASTKGVGLLILDGRRVRRLVQPRPVAIPRSYGSWLFGEWLIQHRSLCKCWI